MSKLNDQAKAAVDKYDADCASKPHNRPASWAAATAAQANGWLFKKPGDKEWTPHEHELGIDLKSNGWKPLDANPY